MALAHDVPDPQYGLTSVIDFAPDAIPDGMRETVSDLDLVYLRSAAQHLGNLLSQLGDRTRGDARDAFPEAMLRYVLDDLAAVDVPQT